MQTPLFITYANTRLSESPEALMTVIDAIEDEFGAIRAVPDLPFTSPSLQQPPPDGCQPTIPEFLRDVAHNIGQFGPDLNIAIMKRAGRRARLPWLDDLGFVDAEIEMAFEATYGFRDEQRLYSNESEEGGCVPCILSNPWLANGVDASLALKQEDFKSKGLNEPVEDEKQMPHVKCYQCQQAAFMVILGHIISGVEYYKIAGFENLMHLALSNYRQAASITGPNQFEQMSGWKSPIDYQGNYLPGPDTDYPFRHIFNQLLMGLVAQSLGKFLADKTRGRARLHQCEICNDFFVDEPRARRCPPPKDCRKAGKQNYQAEFMRKKRNPESKDFDPKYIK